MRKAYGESQTNTCNFCAKIATGLNSQGLPVCVEHKDRVEQAKKCVCGQYLDIKTGKWGPFYLCPNCGPISRKKAEILNGGQFKLNKSFREKQEKEKSKKEKVLIDQISDRIKKEKIYTLDELEKLWDDKT